MNTYFLYIDQTEKYLSDHFIYQDSSQPRTLNTVVQLIVAELLHYWCFFLDSF